MKLSAAFTLQKECTKSIDIAHGRYAIITDMQPENTQPNLGPEQLPMPPVNNGERIPTLPTPETGIETGAERHEQAAEASAAVADAAAYSAPIAVPVIPQQPVVDPPIASTGNPLVAADVDVIEKEWVDKAKDIILKTKDDPSARTAMVNELQKDYLKKRYGKELGASS